ncbi:MAG: hypothetical protein IKV20_02675 [Clostridia bacterium]|nr:hypothetical protein [Clostridia bacterium]
MFKKFKYLLTLLLLISITLTLAACGGDGGEDDEGGEGNVPEDPGFDVVMIDNGVTDYDLYFGTSTRTNAGSIAYNLANEVFYSFGVNDFTRKQYTQDAGTENLIIYGKVDGIAVTEKLAAAVDARPVTSFVWGIAYENGVLALYANCPEAANLATASLADPSTTVYKDLFRGLKDYFKDGKFTVNSKLFYVHEVTPLEYIELVAADKAQYEENQRLERERLAADLKIQLAIGFEREYFDLTGKGYTTNLYSLTSKRYAAPKAYPTSGEHPRLYITSSMIPGILEALENPENKYAAEDFWAKANKNENGDLGPKKLTAQTYHNYSDSVLDIIQAKALAYVLTGEEYYGLSAVYAMQNYIKTLDYDARYSDQCRDFGRIMYIAACVYDWCYDILSENDMFCIIAGIQQKILTGSVPNTSGLISGSSSAVKMEVGFPPTGQDAAAGHGAENQILRDYLAFAIAIFDEAPGWYELIGGRFYAEYVGIRNQYYTAGLYPQGTGGYNSGRFFADLHSAAIMIAATGENPYNEEDMREVLYGLVVTMTNAGDKTIFFVGDSRPTTNTTIYVGECPIISSYVFSDPLARGIAKFLNPRFENMSTGPYGVTAAEFLIFSSNGVVTDEEPFENFPLIYYNGGWYGQMIARNTWGSNAAVALMKIQEKTTGNHDHAAAGTFQIYYKGMLTGDTGDYTGVAYHSDHCKYYHRATISHNGLLIYNSAKASYNSGWYSGGQMDNIGEPSYNNWSNSKYDTGKVTGYSSLVDENGNAVYSYISGDITAAYYADTVDYVGRTMLTVFTDDDTVPMFFFVFDRIDADSASFKKTFLLQVPGEDAPIIDSANKTVTVLNTKAKLVLKNILGGDTITGVGGTLPDGTRQNYLINGKQLHYYGSGKTPQDGTTWGRVEISPNTGNKSDILLNVMYVADKNASVTYSAQGFSAYAATGSTKVLEGAIIGNTAAIFNTGKDLYSEAFKFTAPGSGDVTYYVGGLASGTWIIKVDGQSYGTAISTSEGTMITFTAPAGKEVTVSPSADVRPDIYGALQFELGGGEFASDYIPQDYYVKGEVTALPTASQVTNGNAVFLGWYSDAGYTEKVESIPATFTGTFTAYAKWFDPTIANETMDNVTQYSAINWTECDSHTDSTSDGKCDSCGECINRKTCREGAANNNYVCSTCNKKYTTDRLYVSGFDYSADMDMRNNASAKATVVDIDGNSVLRIDVNSHKDDGLFRIGDKTTTNLANFLSDGNGGTIVPTIEFSIDLAKAEGRNAVSFEIRMFKNRKTILRVDTSGKVYVGSNLITTLTTELKTIKLTINVTDIADGKVTVTAYSEAQGKDVTLEITGGTNSGSDTALQWRFYGCDNATVFVDNIFLGASSSDEE